MCILFQFLAFNHKPKDWDRAFCNHSFGYDDGETVPSSRMTKLSSGSHEQWQFWYCT